ncbi:MAG: HD domain-containing protein [bacterium]|nr:HD domain-containing protein [bacterium]MCS7309105.1 HD domain-containing protein [Armatimonadota bacterium]MDW8103859.1 HD domain-containing phosphohydrolase [Armatimonadota bacterium]
MSFTTFVYLVVGGSVAFLCYYALLWLPQQIRRDYRQGLQALAHAVEIREQGTSGCAHLRAQYATAIARRLSLSSHAVRDIEFAALLQEIGKVSIPYAILNKQEPLTPEEQEVLKLHPVLSQRMVEQVPSLAHLAPIIRHHHENWDGSGYPDGLQAEEIPLASRILHVVGDFADALRGKDLQDTSLRLQTLQQMAASKGKQYDPRVLETLEHIVRQESGTKTS